MTEPLHLPVRQGYDAWSEVYDTDGVRIGEVEDILFTGGTDVLMVRSERGEILIPAARSICVQVDVEAGRLVVKLPDGLLEVNAR